MRPSVPRTSAGHLSSEKDSLPGSVPSVSAHLEAFVASRMNAPQSETTQVKIGRRRKRFHMCPRPEVKFDGYRMSVYSRGRGKSD